MRVVKKTMGGSVLNRSGILEFLSSYRVTNWLSWRNSR